MNNKDNRINATQKLAFFLKDFFTNSEQIRNYLKISSQKNLILCAVKVMCRDFYVLIENVRDRF